MYLRIIVPMYQQESDAEVGGELIAENPLVKQVWLTGLVFTVLIGLTAQVLLGHI